MALGSQSLSTHNIMRGRQDVKTQKIPHPPSTRFYADDHSEQTENAGDDTIFDSPTAKRRKMDTRPGSSPSKHVPSPLQSRLKLGLSTPSSSPSPNKKMKKEEVVDSEDEEVGSRRETETGTETNETERAQTSLLETTLPQISTDAEAIEAYETHRVAEAAEQALEESKDDTLQGRFANRSWTRGRSSIYVDAFNLALSTVLEDEEHLFSDAEKQVFRYWEDLSYEAQYLYVRLFLRKTSTWFRVGKLGYYGDIADLESAVQELQVENTLPKNEEEPPRFPGEKSIPDEALPLGGTFTFAERSDDQITTLNEASSLLLLDELKVIAKEAKVKGKNKTELLKNLRRTSGKQRGLAFIKRSETEDSISSEKSASVYDGDEPENGDHTPEGAVTPGGTSNRDEHFTKKILERTGSCIRLSLIPLKLFERVHLVFYRSTEWTEKSLTILILAKISRRNFPEYVVCRSTTIFESRFLLLEFEASLRTQFRIDSLEMDGTPDRVAHEITRSIFEAVYPRWQAIVVQEQLKEDRVYESGEGAYLRRFSPAWVYTRIVHKALPVLARYKEHLREHGLLCELLDQRLFHAARRGLWYSRKALLEEHYMHALIDSDGRSEEMNKKHWKRVALATCEEGLQDRECHIIYHYDLQKRIKKLEKQLRVPKREQHDFGHVGLLKATERTVSGTKIERDDDNRPALRRRESTENRSQSRERRGSGPPPDQAPTPTRRGAKTVWLDTLDTNEPVGVEAMCLSHYRKNLGWKGYHSEGGILRTLFGLLFYDVLFASFVPNVFQTAYQTCPLDLHTDAFYSARISEVNALINRIANGEAEEIIRATWDAHFERKTCVVGVRWDEYRLEDLLEIVRCWRGEALGVVMRVFAQEYANRGGGVPDLFLWKVNQEDEHVVADEDEPPNNGHDDNNEKKIDMKEELTKATTKVTASIFSSRDNDAAVVAANGEFPNGITSKPEVYGQVMFSEVKSENDRLSDTQRLWISVLLNAGVEVELCHAMAGDVIMR